ncbi:tRNA preQ1(34) S-adenosylmethionine ribosyltransferase-isomerase QueA [Wenxinia marina]|uniref:S-adenosylmethionine:tRNA ribosyltransferase-isomerase n=1 Tax=Wenxinia marina DSM 24838 TaxID=1123501 RepID=A0A0D0QCD0_9RHOB|nr:tRNA preQ1(34) S-adenosylmethionine ribosyltransferase-isomerase QueA [Wenxinia marina]KIQ69982.1 S-adenosylmethionine:tRNA ribosyltransferase-isomerase [Wenxinia marina DSM 24838]GGL62661.1 S-adenosylmethionine:tRNA ribosyltransferase-isomerase [Wenxinia marina]
MRLSDFDFDLPEELIATRPARPRSSARLLHAEGGRIADRRVADLPQILRPGDLLVLNDTKVIPARLTGIRRRGEAEARIEVTLAAPRGDGRWSALVKPLRKWAEGETVVFSPRLSAVMEGREGDMAVIRLAAEGDLDAALAEAGAMPLPPYIAAKRAADEADVADYQTVWAARAGAVAAPTASLHFDQELLAALDARGVERTHVTLHVGAGTFLPVKVDDVSEHRMHSEWGEVGAEAAAAMARAKQEGRRVIPVGTTALRLIESSGGAEWRGDTDIFITPGYAFRVADALMTNFHLPKSTLMMLVSALMGPERIRQIYAHAIAARYRFFSYGDGSLLVPDGSSR